ncbi:LacI family DNA-binding transcriptional regulator [Paenibacillus contaminans]|jgi:LacI family transcriptional regulator|uniref:HTH lacI-type domain-containing protein n=1 Tax=Paenibacillus contaminans TaxID=450362 RepID=A0A329LYW0_9BACL|nr:LacI family DNA-binding transcriptional regulator [Paenibacillus contaminans]RAV12500.1 hypothetical protein DQG23_34800 [Paenibacillus contaminans]
MPRKKSIKLDDLAEELGLTAHTVSKALRGLPGMSEETRRAVREHAAKRGYFTKEQKQAASLEGVPLYAGKPYRFLFVVPTEQLKQSYIHHLLLQGLQERLAEIGHTATMLFMPDNVQTDQQFAAWMEQHEVSYADGIFMTPNTPLFAEQKLLELPMPRILLNFPPPGAPIDSIVWDVYDTTVLAVNHLLANGHKRIMYIGNIKQTRGYKLRWQAFVDAMDQAGLAVSPDDHLLFGTVRAEELTAMFLDKRKRMLPTALICASDLDLSWLYYAYGTLQQHIPTDCSLISLAASPLPSDVTRPAFLIKECGHRAADRMLWRIANPHAPYEQVRLISRLLEGSTVASIKPAGEAR